MRITDKTQGANRQTEKTIGKQEKTYGRSAETAVRQKEISTQGDFITISAEGLGLLQDTQGENAEREKLQNDAENVNETLKKMFQEQMESAKSAGNAFRDLAKLMEIARRISNGDKVPGKDEQKLMEYSQELYLAAKSAAFLNEHKKHKEYDSLYEEEQDTMREQLQNLENDSSVSESEASTEPACEMESTEA